MYQKIKQPPDMKFDNFLQLFVVKEKRFFPLFIKSAENIVKAATLLIEQTKETDPDERRIYAKRVKECETAGDGITDKIIDELLEAFVTPFDRDDIHRLAQDLDTVLDDMRDASKKFAIYQPKSNDRRLVELAEYILKDAELFLVITNKFENMRSDITEIDRLCDEIQEVEHIADDIYEQYMSKLFEEETDAIELVKKKNIVQALEDTCDAAKDVADTIRSIVVKMG